MSYLSQGCEDQDRPPRAEHLLTLAVRGGPGQTRTSISGVISRENWRIGQQSIKDETQKINEHLYVMGLYV